LCSSLTVTHSLLLLSSWWIDSIAILEKYFFTISKSCRYVMLLTRLIETNVRVCWNGDRGMSHFHLRKALWAMTRNCTLDFCGRKCDTAPFRVPSTAIVKLPITKIHSIVKELPWDISGCQTDQKGIFRLLYRPKI